MKARRRDARQRWLDAIRGSLTCVLVLMSCAGCQSFPAPSESPPDATDWVVVQGHHYGWVSPVCGFIVGEDCAVDPIGLPVIVTNRPDGFRNAPFLLVSSFQVVDVPGGMRINSYEIDAADIKGVFETEEKLRRYLAKRVLECQQDAEQ